MWRFFLASSNSKTSFFSKIVDCASLVNKTFPHSSGLKYSFLWAQVRLFLTFTARINALLLTLERCLLVKRRLQAVRIENLISGYIQLGHNLRTRLSSTHQKSPNRSNYKVISSFSHFILSSSLWNIVFRLSSTFVFVHIL